MDAAAAGKKPSAAGAAKNEMKAILESFNKVEECGMEMPQQMPEQDPVTMNVTLNARGKDAIQDLIDLMNTQKCPTAPQNRNWAYSRYIINTGTATDNYIYYRAYNTTAQAGALYTKANTVITIVKIG